MDEKEKLEYIKKIRAFSREIASDKKKARAYLVKLGTHTRTGKLTKNYKIPACS